MLDSAPLKHRPIRQWIARTVLRLTGWQVVLAQPVPAKAVLIFYPHTSNWDFFFGLLTKWATGVDCRFVAKHTLFRCAFGRWLRAVGGIPVDRRAPSGMVGQLVEEFARRQTFLLAITPEGTRGYVPGWKSGFYRIARATGTPLGLAFADYGRRRIGIGAYLTLTRNRGRDWKAIADFYAGMSGRRPERQAPIRPREREAA